MSMSQFPVSWYSNHLRNGSQVTCSLIDCKKSTVNFELQSHKSYLELNPLQSSYRQEEQKWLDALEKGELDDFGRVKQDKDVSMMTARQV